MANVPGGRGRMRRPRSPFRVYKPSASPSANVSLRSFSAPMAGGGVALAASGCGSGETPACRRQQCCGAHQLPQGSLKGLCPYPRSLLTCFLPQSTRCQTEKKGQGTVCCGSFTRARLSLGAHGSILLIFFRGIPSRCNCHLLAVAASHPAALSRACVSAMDR